MQNVEKIYISYFFLQKQIFKHCNFNKLLFHLSESQKYYRKFENWLNVENSTVSCFVQKIHNIHNMIDTNIFKMLKKTFIFFPSNTKLHTRIRKFKIISYHQPVNFCLTLTLHISFQNCIIEYFKFQYWLNFEYSQKLYSLYTAML